MFGNDERFEAIERVRDREDIYEEFVADLEKKASFVLIWLTFPYLYSSQEFLYLFADFPLCLSS